MVHRCWRESAEADHVLLDLLVCRIQRGVDRDANARLFLERVGGALGNAVKGSYGRLVREREGVSAQELLHDLQVLVLEEVLTGYVFGSRTPITHWLFAHRTGTVARHLQSRWRAVLRRGEEVAVEENEPGTDAAHERWSLPPERVREALEHPGFSPAERRVLGFALHAGDFAPAEYAELVGRSRSAVRREYGQGLRRLATVLGLDEGVLGGLANEVPESAHLRRRGAWLHRDPQASAPLTSEETEGMVRLMDEGWPAEDVAWAYGVAPDTLRRRRRRAGR